MYTFYALATVVAALALGGCEEEQEGMIPAKMPTDSTVVVVETPPPAISALASTVSTIVKFGIEVSADQAQDTVHYLVLRDTTEAPTPADLLRHVDATVLSMNGNLFRTGVWFNLQERTEYVVYAMLKNDQRISEVASLGVTTGKAE